MSLLGYRGSKHGSSLMLASVTGIHWKMGKAMQNHDVFSSVNDAQEATGMDLSATTGRSWRGWYYRNAISVLLSQRKIIIAVSGCCPEVAADMAGDKNDWSGDRNGSLPPEVAAGLKDAGGPEGLRSGLPDEAVIKMLADRHQALSDPVRLSILYLLRNSDLCPCVLKDLTRLSDSKLSYHLSILEKAGMIVWRQSKNWRVYSLTEMGRTALP